MSNESEHLHNPTLTGEQLKNVALVAGGLGLADEFKVEVVTEEASATTLVIHPMEEKTAG